LLLARAPGRCVEGGYAADTSVPQGGTIALHISTRRPTYTLSIYREGVQRILMKRVTGLAGVERSCPEPGYETGCGWPVSYTLAIPSNWPSGVYTGDFDTGTSGTGKKILIFVVRENQPGSTSRMFCSIASNTHNAYNGFGGKSLYNYNSSNEVPARKVSYLRPYESPGDGSYYRREHPFVSWAEGLGYVLEYGTNVDLHRDPNLLGHYSCFIALGHDEYWSREMRDHLDAFVMSGGGAAILSGNTCWWQVRFSADLRTMLCYKAFAMQEDPFARDGIASNDYLITTNWYKSPVNYPENSTTGLGWRDGGYHDTNGNFTYDQGFGGYRVYRTGHWIFEGTGLVDGQMLGREETIVGYEVDGTPLEARDASGNLAWDSKRHYPLPGALPHVINTSVSKTPSNFLILGMAPATKGYGVMGYFEKGNGRVFNAGTIDWVQGLAAAGPVARITMNVLSEFSGSPPPGPPPLPDELILDNGESGTTPQGSWTASGGANPYGANSLYSRSVGATYAYKFNLGQGGACDVYLWWTDYYSRLTNVPVDIAHAGGTSRVTVNQQANGGRWNRVGTWSFGSQATVTIVSLGNGTTCADAVRLVAVGSPNKAPTASIDSVQPNPASLGTSVTFQGRGSDDDGSVVGYRWRSSLDGDLSTAASFSTTTLSAGSHTIYFRVQDDAGSWSSEVQTSLGITAGSPAPGIIMDDGSPGTIKSGYWPPSGAPNPYGTGSLYSREPNATYAYRFNLPSPGTYEVHLWWTEYYSRLPNVPVEVTHGSGTAQLTVNQLTNGGRWNRVGAWTFGSQATVTIRSLGAGTTCADAVMLVKTGS
jgi:hypothetical protein